MKRRIALLLVVALGAIGGLGAAPAVAFDRVAGHTLVAVVPAKTCGAGYVRGVIGGAVKCLRRGEYCSAAYASQYVQYGFHCVNGRLR